MVEGFSNREKRPIDRLATNGLWEEHPLILWLVKIGGVGVGDDGKTGFPGKVGHPALHRFLRIASLQMAFPQDRRIHVRRDCHIKGDQSLPKRKDLCAPILNPVLLKSSRAASGVNKRDTYSR